MDLTTKSLFSLDGRLALITGSAEASALRWPGAWPSMALRRAQRPRSEQGRGGAVAKLRDAGFKAHASVFDVTDFAGGR